MKKIKVSFKNAEGYLLKGILELPTNEKPKQFALFAHCFTCNKNFHAPTNISSALSNAGYGVLRFDFTGLGDSEGDFTDSNFSGNVTDLVSAAQFLEKEYQAPQLIIGHSLGGAAILFAVRKIPSILAMATINAPSTLTHLKKHFLGSLDEIKKSGKAQVNIGGRPFQIKKQFIDDLEKNEDGSAFENLKIPLLIMHSPQDKIVSVDHAEALYRSAWHPKSFVSLDHADHLLSKDQDSLYAGNLIATWASKYIKTENIAIPEMDHQVMANLGSEGFTTQLQAGDHFFIADEPLSFGGKDLGPNPYQFVSGGLAACTSMTIQMYARRKNWLVDNVETHVSYSKKYAEDCENCEDSKAKIDVFEREIILKGDLDDKQKKRLLEIADKCPVHKTLATSSNIKTTIKE
ncbi:bifunctional alpha/beta hydrolase/OsmC family protein [Gramella sp. AN32]|uniref:Alpha/beta fold hydrolase n=1 Tax=Christiangramia antarctica TaxID=2058158 RepID=A0ABW5XC42_9FLAO|nr:bifunctional alpha/beta hydrolase/OsmC family protein [Gramella sp. AN32]MCM4156569.1 osmotically inducible protein C [Gramella sp. AN32]